MYSDIEKEQILSIQSKYGIDDARFIKGLSFAEALVDGEKANNAYALVFGVSSDEASTKSANMKRSKWVQELVMFLKVPEEIKYIDHKAALIEENMQIAMSSVEETSDKINASKAVHAMISQESKARVEAEQANETLQIVGDLMKSIANISGQGKMISPKGDIIDLKVLM